MTEMCSHGYTWGTCPHGCKPTTSAEEPLPLELPSVPMMEEKLKCVICGKDVDEGTVFQGKAICTACKEGLKAIQ